MLSATLYMPSAAPKLSISGFLCPMMNILEDWLMSSFNAWAIILDLPLLLFSTL